MVIVVAIRFDVACSIGLMLVLVTKRGHGEYLNGLTSGRLRLGLMVEKGLSRFD